MSSVLGATLFVLPEGVDSDKIFADYRNGMLEITASVAASALPKKIEIRRTPSRQTR
jgi:HSP20 family molecular chaperone IbpA